jgi:hypothetical protein
MFVSGQVFLMSILAKMSELPRNAVRTAPIRRTAIFMGAKEGDS